ncbi:ligand-binding sensor domain-containing protein/signal transduction histidine kinase/DNA-binding NarL/FixJ family response regulator [Pedobacter sp. CAN_A7]|uniref:hybrid sensor histidine kinase/response regulator transcription factor n=1 Tax=Pedobacter sp. CAN_A7 TaxID=2787722 RepID=UPI0018C9F138
MKTAILLFLVLYSSITLAQFPSGRIHHYSRKDGLSYGSINSILQDNSGFIWLATGDGLNRFDGLNFNVFKHEVDNPFSLPGNYVQKIFKDSKGEFWVSSRKGLYRFNTKSERFTNLPLTAESEKADVSHIAENGQHNIWVSTSGNGFYYLDRKTGKNLHYSMKNLKGLSSNSILKIFEDAHGLLWVGTRDAGVSVFRVSNGKILEKVNLGPLLQTANRVNAIYQDRMQNIWIATSAGLLLFERGSSKSYHFKGSAYGLRSNVFLSIVQDSQQQLFVGLQDGGLYKVNLRISGHNNPTSLLFEELKHESGFHITERSVQELFFDKEGNLWAGTYGDGIFMLSRTPDKFKAFHKKLEHNGSENYIRYYGMCIDDEGYLWMGTDGDGIYKTTVSGKIVRHYRADGKANSIKDNAILYAYKDSRNTLWFGTYSKGLFRYNRKSDSFVNYAYQPKTAGTLGGNDVRVIQEDNQHRIWVGTNGGGLSMLDQATGKFTTYNEQNSNIGSNDVRSLQHDDKGNVWVGTYGGGLLYFKVKEGRFYPFVKSKTSTIDLSRDIIFSLYLDRQKRLWIGTEGNGLVLYNTVQQTTERFIEKNGLGDNTVYAIQEEAPGKIWISTNDGLSKIELQSRKIYNFNVTDGLQAGQFNPGSATASSHGDLIFFGGTEGYNLFYPKKIKQSNDIPDVKITGLQLYGIGKNELDNTRNISEEDQIILAANQSVFSIQYTALNYAYPRSSDFAYQLEGLDKEWNYVKHQKSATYRYLQPGHYIFKVKATNQDGIWQDDFASIRIQILPPWYKTWWAYTFYVALTGGLIYFLIQYNANQHRLKYKIRLARIQAQKEQELHENKLSFFTNISHEFRTPLTLIINPVKEILDEKGGEGDRDNLNIVYRNARRLLSLVDQLLLFSKAEMKADKLKITEIDLYNLCEEVFLCFSYQASKKNISYTFTCLNKDISVYGDREKIEIALFNLISNAVRYSPEGGHVSLTIVEHENKFEIQLADTGSGIAESTGDKIFERFYKVHNTDNYAKGGFGIGLYLVKSFVERHHGTVTYHSVTGEGTTFELTLLKGREHFKDEQIFDHQLERSVILGELAEGQEQNDEASMAVTGVEDEISSEQKTILIIDDNKQIRDYIRRIFEARFQVFDAEDGQHGLQIIREYLPDIVISDVVMPNLTGVELCKLVKEDPSLYHIPFVLLTAGTSSEVKLRGIECGADDYISKPFEKELLVARIEGLLKSRNDLQKYFYNRITLKSSNLKISAEYKGFLDRCIEIVEKHMADPNFGIQTLADEIGMSRSSLYGKIKSISGQSANSFIRFIRLRKAAEIFVSTEHTIQETTFQVGIKDARYFREQFHKVFNMNPSDYIKKYRKTFNSKYSLNKSLIKGKDPK